MKWLDLLPVSKGLEVGYSAEWMNEWHNKEWAVDDPNTMTAFDCPSPSVIQPLAALHFVWSAGLCMR
jgi:hypothetical protein